MIVIVAPYSPPSREGMAHLGASRKLEMIISILSRLDQQLVLVNSAHNGSHPAPLEIRQVVIGGVALMEITPPLSASRVLGKLKHIFCVDQVLDAVQKLGKPQGFWLYNGYAFEMRIAEKARRRFRVPMILEFEDWHFSRSRGLNPKPYIDYFFWRRAARLMSGTFVVNTLLAEKTRSFSSDVDMLPGVVPKALAVIAKASLPFSVRSGPIKVGYFGGLSAEKGADIVLQLATALPEGYVLQVTGTGPLATDFDASAKENPSRLNYHGRVDDAKLYQLIASCDVMLNPHSSIEEMNNGVFPFKVIEAIASGRLLISTAVPTQGLEDVLVGVQFVDHNANAFHSAIVASRQYCLNHATLVAKGADVANQRFGEDALLGKVRSMVNSQRLLN